MITSGTSTAPRIEAADSRRSSEVGRWICTQFGRNGYGGEQHHLMGCSSQPSCLIVRHGGSLHVNWYGNRGAGQVNLILSIAETGNFPVLQSAIRAGIPYQTLVSSVLHKYVEGQFTDKSA
jgi:hypothetical protein